MRNIENMQEYNDAKKLKERLSKLPSHAVRNILEYLSDQLSWQGSVDREWLDKEIADQERVIGQKAKSIDGHPIEDIFGTDIQPDDVWFQDPAGRVVLNENVAQYLQEVAEVPCYRMVKA